VGIRQWWATRRTRRAPTNVFVTPTSTGRQTGLSDRVSNVEGLTRAVLYVTIVTLVGVLVGLAAIVLDQWRFNQQAYKESSAQAIFDAKAAEAKVNDLNAQINALSVQLKAAQQSAKPTQ